MWEVPASPPIQTPPPVPTSPPVSVGLGRSAGSSAVPAQPSEPVYGTRGSSGSRQSVSAAPLTPEGLGPVRASNLVPVAPVAAATEPPLGPSRSMTAPNSGLRTESATASRQVHGTTAASTANRSAAVSSPLRRHSTISSEDDMMVTSSASELSDISADSPRGPAQGGSVRRAGPDRVPTKSRDTAGKIQTQPRSSAMQPGGAASSSVRRPDFQVQLGAPELSTSEPDAASVGAAEEQEEDVRRRLVRALCAVHALRASELGVLLSSWQADWLLSREDLCSQTALSSMMRLQARRRPRRRHGAERIGLRSSASGGLAAPPRAGSAETQQCHPVVSSTHGQLAEWQRSFRSK